MSPNNGGPAFPEVVTDLDYNEGTQERFPNTYSVGGMTLRQWYAGLAMQGLCASGEYRNATADWIAHEADAIADAMLAAREGDKA